jgi:hypothetical protein
MVRYNKIVCPIASGRSPWSYDSDWDYESDGEAESREDEDCDRDELAAAEPASWGIS